MEIKFDSVSELVEIATSKNTTISQICLEQTAADLDTSTSEVYSKMEDIFIVMKESAKEGVKAEVKSVSGLTGGMAYTYKEYVNKGKSLTGSFLGEILYNSLGIAEENACMGRIVACPTAGSCGIVPGCLIAVQNKYEIDDNSIIMGLFNTSAIGMIISKNASISGAEGGCQAECGSAAAMAASAIVEIMGGTPQMCADAAAQALKSVMGLICDPVAGLVEEPCVIRNASCSGIALIAADLTLSGIKSIIPADEVILAMGKVGNMLPYQLRETALGGIADTPTGKKISAKLYG